MLNVMDQAPNFTLPQTDGTMVTLSSLKGNPVVLFFYPKDDTPGCTIESIAFSTKIDAFIATGAKVFGISKDGISSHVKFTTKHNLKVPLLSDEKEAFAKIMEFGKRKICMGKSTWVLKGPHISLMKRDILQWYGRK
jgi:peroxiredoxin Q/BCP